MALEGWHRVDPVDVPDDGRVRSVVVDGRTVALARCGARLGALDNRCPHQGGPLGEGSIENGWLRCPWHGYDYDPISGRPPEGFSDAVTSYEVDERADGVYVRLPELPPPTRTVADVLVETLVAYGVTHVFGMVGHSNLGFADALRRAEERGELTYVGIRHEGAAAFAASAYGKLTGGLLRHRRPGFDEPAHRPVRREAGPGAGGGDLRPGAVEGARPGRVPGSGPVGRVPGRGRVDRDRPQWK